MAILLTNSLSDNNCYGWMLQNHVYVGNIVKLEDFGRGYNKPVLKQSLYFIMTTLISRTSNLATKKG